MDQRKITREMRKYLETNENPNTACQNLWDAVEGLLVGKFTVNTLKTRETEGHVRSCSLAYAIGLTQIQTYKKK